ncbi:MAG: trypsin-like peptidase domain-containing protein [Planctomycetes bacterium]|nr:trypsin-like peptidase domain-containing protein [Planctomycetota bacterium]
MFAQDRHRKQWGNLAAAWSLISAVLFCGSATLYCGSAAGADEEPAVKLFKDVNGCVVALENIEGSGTGFVIDKSGLILTNAHVVASPLPYKCTIDVRRGGKVDSVTFKKVKIVGLHPEKDLALVRIDPKEHNASLQVAKLTKTRPSPGQRVYAIGNPAGGDGMVLNKSITSGMLSGLNRVIDKVSYYQVDAAINPGNSGGPLFNSNGEVVGVVTLKFTNAENTGFAIPIADLDTSKFVAMRQRRGDPEEAKLILAEANKYLDRAKRSKKDSTDEQMNLYISAKLYHRALSVDPSNDTTYYNFGMLLNALEKYDIAVAYLTQAIEINPWEKDRTPGTGLYYRELAVALAKQNKSKEARAVWEEGLAKHPKSAKLWEDIAILFANTNDPYNAAYHAQVALQMNSPDARREQMNRLLQDMTGRLNPTQRKKLDTEVAKIPKELKRRQDESDRSRQSKKEFLTKAFAEYLGGEGVVTDKKAEKTPQVVVSSEAPAEAEAKPPVETPDPAAEPFKKVALPAGAVDLLRSVTVRHDAFKGTWTEDDNGILSPSIPCARIKLPAKLPGEYDLLLVVERQSNKGEFVVGFVRDGRQSMFYFDADRAKVSGLDISARDAHQGAIFTNGKPATIVMKVRKEGLMVSVDGKRIFMQRSTDPFPGVPEEWNVRDEATLFIGAEASRYRIYQAAMKAFERK